MTIATVIAGIGAVSGAIERLFAFLIGLALIGAALVLSMLGLLLRGPMLVLFFLVTWYTDKSARAGWHLIKFAGRSHVSRTAR